MRIEVARRLAVVLILSLAITLPESRAAGAPEGTMTWGVHITLASRWLDPAETEGIITPFMVLYALHDALVKPMPAGAWLNRGLSRRMGSSTSSCSVRGSSSTTASRSRRRT